MTELKEKKVERLRETAGKTLWAEFDGFSLFPTKDKKKLVAAQSVNCTCADGSIRGGIGYKRLLDENGNAMRTLAKNNLRAVYILESWLKDQGEKKYYFLLADDGLLYEYSAEYDGYVGKASFGAGEKVGIVAATACDGETKLLISGKGGTFVADAGTWYRLEESTAGNGCGALCFYQNRIFVGETPCKILYSDPETPWDFTPTYDEGGYVLLPMDKGKMVGAVAYGGSVYFFFERGITALKPDGLARNFKLSDVAYAGGEIFAGSMGVCGNYLFFLSENGICRFDGKRVENVGDFLHVYPERGGQVCDHANVGGYFVLRYRERDGIVFRTVALRADGQDGYEMSEYAGLNECDRLPLCAVDNYFCVLTQNGDLPAGEKRAFTSALVDFGDCVSGFSLGFGRKGGYVGKMKSLKTVTLYGGGCFTFEVYDGSSWHTWEIEDLPQKLTLNVGVRSEAFRFRFILDKDAHVDGMILQAEVGA